MSHTSTQTVPHSLFLVNWYTQTVHSFSRFFRYRYRIVVALFFGAYLLLGLSIAGDYGTNTDEWVHCRNRGIIFVKLAISRINGVVFGRPDTELEALYAAYDDKDYGAVYEMAMVAVEGALRLKDERSITLSRHIFVFVVFWLSAYFFYQLIGQRFHSWRIGLLGCLMLILSPRIFADSFYNSKDIGFLRFYIQRILVV